MDIWDEDDNPWIHKQRKLALVSAILYPEVRDQVNQSATGLRHTLGWTSGVWGLCVGDDDGPQQSLYSTGKMVEMVMVATHRRDEVKALMEKSIEELDRMLKQRIFAQAIHFRAKRIEEGRR